MIQLTKKQKYGLAAAALATSFAVGRFTVPEKVKIETKVVTVEKKVTDDKTVKKDIEHKKVTRHEIDTPDGKKDITTTITDDHNDDIKTDDKVRDDVAQTVDKTKEVTRGDSKVTISALAGINVTNPAGGIVYGASITKPVLGPITIGGFGLSNGTAGASVGLQF